mgnify:CR=1 FL=1
MTFETFSLVWPEVILAVSAMALLVVGAFRGKGGPVFDGISMLVLLVAGAAAVTGEHGRAFAGGVVVVKQ